MAKNDSVQETKSTKIMKYVVVAIFAFAVLLGLASFALDDVNESGSSSSMSVEERPF
jgi:hypothetical protein